MKTNHKLHCLETEQSGWRGPTHTNPSPSPPAGQSTGPRTMAGKLRSRNNALKSGIFAKDVLLKGESPAEFRSLLKGLREDFQPQGTIEAELVANLAKLFWRKRRIPRAESAEITKKAEFMNIDLMQAQVLEAWDLSRAGESTGGMLRHLSNPFVIQRAIVALKELRESFVLCGFRKGEFPALLKRLYGLNYDQTAPFGIFRTYKIYSDLATEVPNESNTSKSPDELKRKMVEFFDKEIVRLTRVEALQRSLDERKGEYQSIEALVPSLHMLDGSIRSEAHLSREIRWTLNELERIQKNRRGQPVPPSVRVELSR